jgi:hypothetical protein
VPQARGIAATDRQKLFLVMQDADAGSGSHRLQISGRGFSPGENITLQCREVPSLTTRVRIDERGQFAVTLPLPAAFPQGDFTIDARDASRVLTAGEFRRPTADDSPAAPGIVRQQRQR